MAPKKGGKKAPAKKTAAKSKKNAQPQVQVPLIKRNSRRVSKGVAASKTKNREAREAALSAAKAQAKGVNTKSDRKIRTSVKFRRPKTLRLARDPKYPRRSAPRATKLDAFRVIKYPLTTESAMKKIEEEGSNTLVFIVDIKSNKNQIKQAVTKLYDVKAAKVNTLIRPDGKKKAFVKLHPDYDVLEVANKIGII